MGEGVPRTRKWHILVTKQVGKKAKYEHRMVMLSPIIRRIPPDASRHENNLGAFTLIELLVCVSIVLILAALLFPSLGAARNKAALAGCASNMRQLGIGMNGYASDNGNFFPPTWSDPWTYELTQGGYISDTKVFLCPGDTINKVGPDPNTGKSWGRSYSYCSSVMTPGGSPTERLNRLVIERPSKQYLLTEWHGADFSLGGDGKPIQGLIRGIVPFDTVSPSHKNGCNFLFADGHVEFRTDDITDDPYSGWLLNQFND
jgi:prepilin-type processing-associated H-X9-DG protein/prepilin-type N-terminal cleavage/methylation domain-containing protein